MYFRRNKHRKEKRFDNQFSWGRYDLEGNYNGKVDYIRDDVQGRVTIFLSGKMISSGAKSVLQPVQQLEHKMGLLINGSFINKEHNLKFIILLQ